MVRLIGVVLPDNKRIEYAITMLYGIGWVNAAKILEQAKIDKHKKVANLTEDEMKRISMIIEKNYKVEGNLRENISENLKRLREINSYRGIRHLKGLPVRGQRTKSNARTKRGKRRTVGAMKKEERVKVEQAAQKT